MVSSMPPQLFDWLHLMVARMLRLFLLVRQVQTRLQELRPPVLEQLEPVRYRPPVLETQPLLVQALLLVSLVAWPLVLALLPASLLLLVWLLARASLLVAPEVVLPSPGTISP